MLTFTTYKKSLTKKKINMNKVFGLRLSWLVFLTISFISLNSVFGQNGFLVVNGYISKDSKPLSDVTIDVIKNGSKSFQKKTGMDGKFEAKLEINNEFIVEVQKDGLLSQKFRFNTNLPPKEATDKIYFFEVFTELFQAYPGVDASCLEQPMIAVEFDSEERDFIFDVDAAEQQSSRVYALKKKINELIKQSAKYDSEIAKADNLFNNEEYDKARVSYNVAMKSKPAEEYPKTQVIKIDQILASSKNAEAYKKAIADGDLNFNQKKYDLAKASYKIATTLKPTEAYPKEKIAEIDNMLAEIEKENSSYKKAISDGDALFLAKQYDKAKTQYLSAGNIKPTEQYPKDKVNEINGLLANINTQNQSYIKAIAEADNLFNSKSYDLAKTSYQKASGMKPDEKYPKDKIAEITNLQSALLAKNQNYTKFIADADLQFSQKNYEIAKQKYSEASDLKPDEKYPKDKITEINNIFAQQNSQNQAYIKSIAEADNLFNTKSYDLAKVSYQKASGLKPNEKYPKDKITEISTLLAEQLKQKQAYDKAIADADLLFNSKTYEKAKDAYVNAGNIRPDEKYPKDKIAEINAIFAQQNSQNQAYFKAIADADNFFNTKVYDKAKEAYTNASKLKVEEKYPKDKLVEIASIQASQLKLKQNYDKAIADADALMLAKNYDKAKDGYNAALVIKSDEKYPKDKITEINNLLAQQKNTLNQNYLKAIADADVLFNAKNYDKAKEGYTGASKIKPEEKYPNDKLLEIASIQAELLKTKQAYDKAVADADILFKAKDYNKAKDAYLSASNIKSDEKYPKDKINEINGILAQADNANKVYYTTIAEADNLFNAKSYDLAKTSYQKASGLKPDEKYPKDKILEIGTLLAEQQKQKQAYDKAIADADALFNSKNYDKAKDGYNGAIAIKSDEKYPKDKITEINKLLAMQKDNLNQSYQKAIADADALFNVKNYDKAKDGYNSAIAIKSDEKYPKDKLLEIATLQAELLKVKQAYDKAIADADILFKAKDYNKAKDGYSAASNIKSDEKYPKDKINEINGILAQLDNANQAYFKTIAEADNLFNTKSYDLAKASYQKASGLKPDEKYPKDKIAEIGTLLAEQLKQKQIYDKAIADADALFNSKNYEKAKDGYVNANVIRPDEKYPKDKITEINTLLGKQNELNQNYFKTIADADNLFNSKTYDKAKEAYTSASLLRPDEKYPKEKITEITNIMADAQSKKVAYDKAIADGDALFKLKSYEKAKDQYVNAGNLKPDEKYPHDKITEINGLLAQQNELSQAYYKVITEADNLFNSKSYAQAKTAYENASKIKSDEKYPYDKITEINNLLADAQNKEQNYKKLLADADALLASKTYEKAKEGYTNASKIKPDDQYPKGKITEIDNLIAEQKKIQLNQNYQDAITKGDADFNAKLYANAKTSYLNASKLKPAEQYPIDKITQIDKFLGAQEDMKENYNAAISKADNLYLNKKLDLAIKSYQDASKIMPNEKYPKDKIAEINAKMAANNVAITKVEDKEMVEVSSTIFTIKDQDEKKFTFNPLAKRNNNYMIIKAKNTSGKKATIYMYYGEGNMNGGGFVVALQDDAIEHEYKVRVSSHSKWVSSNSNWINLSTSGGSIEISSVKIFRGE
ncbi:MAG: hypothetical protein HXX09_00905 [Bacteroidetes bacterium]|nr:hypothetical protein [Bacteroidota bacterium]